MRLLNQKLLVLILLKVVSGQVNTDVEKLKSDFEMKGRIYGYNSYMGWFNPNGSSNYVKLMMCVDVVQKMENMRLMGSRYKYRQTPEEIPEFEIETMRIENAKLLTQVLHCPLSTIKFDNLPNTTIENFYIIDSLHRYCVYMMKPSSTPGKLNIVAEICGIFVDIRYNQMELEEELRHKLERTSTGLDFLPWPELNDMMEETKLVLCFEFYEKISYYTYYTKSNIEYPQFGIPTHFKLLFSNGEVWKGHTQTLSCPMNQIEFSTGFKSKINCGLSALPFHLAKSINPGCVYKVQLLKNNNDNLTDEDYHYGVFIQVELCGILDTPRTDTHQLQNEFLSAWNATIMQPNATIPSFELLNLNGISEFRLCQNVYKKLYRERKIQNSNNYEGIIKNFRLSLAGTWNVEVMAMRCVSGRKTTVDILYLLESVNLGCVYKLSKYRHHGMLQITAEICNVYPIDHLLNYNRQSSQGGQFIIDPN